MQLLYQAVGKLINYLDNNLMTLNSNLLRTNFLRILNSIWQEVLEEFDQVLSRPDEVCYSRLSVYLTSIIRVIKWFIDVAEASFKWELQFNPLKGRDVNWLHLAIQI